MPQQLQDEFCNLVFVGASPTRGSSVRSPSFCSRAIFQGRDVIVSISACDADCAGANPVALTISFRWAEHIGLSVIWMRGGRVPLWLLTEATEPEREIIACSAPDPVVTAVPHAGVAVNRASPE